MKYREIKIENWSRKNHYQFFQDNFLFPHTSITAQVNVTKLVSFCRNNNLSLFHATVFFVSKTLNSIQEFRQRIRLDMAIEWEVAHPSYTVMGEGNQFLFCDVEYDNDLFTFHRRSLEVSRQVKAGQFAGDLNHLDNRFFMSCLPWVHFTHMGHPIHSAKEDAVPRIAWGKITSNTGGDIMPLNIQGHHSFVDGHHFGLAFETFQNLIDSL